MKKRIQDLYDTLCPVCNVSIIREDQNMCDICYDFKLLTNTLNNIVIEEKK